MVYFIPTPIGNLEDISQRALRILSQTTCLLCEDTRITKKLLSLLSEKYTLNLKAEKFISFHSHNEKEVLQSLNIKELQEEKIAFVSDAGMPSISDPGALLIKFCQENSIDYEVLPGANAALLAYVASGFEGNFLFFGFLPHKGKEREIALQNILNNPFHTIIYEAPHRILKLFETIINLDETRKIFAIKEATKLHEKKFFGSAKEILTALKSCNTKGEWALVIEKNKNPTSIQNFTKEDILPLKLPPKQKAKLLAKVTDKSVAFWYEQLKK